MCDARPIDSIQPRNRCIQACIKFSIWNKKVCSTPGFFLPLTLSPGWDPPLGRPLPVPGWASPPGWSLPVPGWFAPPGRPLPVPGWAAPPRWSLPVPGWTIPLDPPDGPHGPLVVAGPRLGYTARSPGWAAPPAGRCRSPVGLYRSVPRVGRTAQLTAAGPWVGSTARLTTAGPRVGRAPRLSAAGPGCALPLGPPGVSHRPVGRCWSRVVPGWAPQLC